MTNSIERPEPDLLARIRTGDYLEETEFPPLAWAVHGLIPEGMGLFTGPPKAGKSWAALGIGLAVATGGSALGKIPTGAPRPVLLLALEDGERRLKGRCRKLLPEAEPIPPNLHYLTNATPALIVPLIRQWLAEYHHRNPLIILDTLGKVMPPALPGEGAYQRDYRIGSALKGIVDDFPGSTLLVVHHVRKLGSEDWMDSTSGTNGLNGAADFTLNLSRKRNEEAGVLRVTGRDVPESEYAVTSADGNWSLDGDELSDAAAKAEQVRLTENLGDRSAEIVAYVASQTEPVTARAVENALGVKYANTYLTRLETAGRITRVGRGTYTGVTSVSSVSSERLLETHETHETHVVETCQGCGSPLDDVDGFGTHPGCEVAQ